MASSKASAAVDRRVKPALTASNTGFMPADAAYEILLRVPAKDLCRFRAVCQPWRSLLSDPHFIAAHAAHHPDPEPLIIASCYTNRRENGVLCDVMDLSGRVVKQAPSTRAKDECVVFTQQDLICTKKGRSESFRLLNPADGAVHALPGGLAEEHAKLDIFAYEAQIAFGLVASTGEYKVFRVLKNIVTIEQWCEILTLDGSNIPSPWRAKDNPTNSLNTRSRLVIDGIVYFFSLDDALLDHDDAWHCIASFDLQTEEWRGTILGPQTNHVGDAIDDDANLSMAALSGSLVVVHCFLLYMDLWFLADFEKCLWVKQHSIQVDFIVHDDQFRVRPLLVLNDGRILIYIGTWGLLRVYNPRTSAYIDVAEIGPRLGIGLYTGNILSLANGAS